MAARSKSIVLGFRSALCVALTFLIVSAVGNAVSAATLNSKQEKRSNTSVISRLTEPADIFNAKCASCHVPGKFGPTIPQLSRLTAEEIENVLWNGAMKEFALDLDSSQRAIVAQWLASLGQDKGDRTSGVKKCTDGTAWVPDAGPSWSGWSNDNRLNRNSKESGITSAQFSGTRLSLALPLPPGQPVVGAANPVAIVGNRLFVGNTNRWVYALNPESGCAYWTFRAEGRIRSNVAVEKDILVFGDLLGNLYGINANSGALLWQRRVDASSTSRINGNVTLHNGVVYAGVSGLQELSGMRKDIACCSFRGSVVAMNARSGERLWKTSMVDEPLKFLGRTKDGVNRYGPSGVPVWSGIAVDEKRRALYVSTGNQYTEPRVKESDAIVALDIDSGKKKWIAELAPEQMNRTDIYHLGCETWVDPKRSTCSPVNPKGHGDRDFGAPASLVTLADRSELVLAGSKDGMFYALNPDSGQIIWQLRVGKGGEIGGIEYGFATDGENAYVPVGDVDLTTNKASGTVTAISLKTGKPVWRYAAPQDVCINKPEPCNNSFYLPPVVAGEVVLSGTNDGVLRALSRSDGHLIWSFDTAIEFVGPNGLKGNGGSLGFGGPVVVGNRIFVMSGHDVFGLGMPGNVLLSFTIPR